MIFQSLSKGLNQTLGCLVSALVYILLDAVALQQAAGPNGLSYLGYIGGSFLFLAIMFFPLKWVHEHTEWDANALYLGCQWALALQLIFLLGWRAYYLLGI